MPRRSRGFTLVELLVALFAMAILALLSWRGLDSMARVQQQTQSRADEVLALQVGLAQWAADLDNLIQLPQTSAMDWNGRVLRLTRRSTTSVTDGVLVVAWTRRETAGGGQWLRWQSPPAATREELARALERANAWAQTPAGPELLNEVAITPLANWQLFYYRGNAWTNPLSSDATAAPTGGPVARVGENPDGVRLVLQLPPGQPLSGELVRDWVRSTVGGGKS